MNLKKQVGYKAAEFIENDMVIGLGTGSTVYYLVEALGKRIKEKELDFIGVTTSNRTAEQAKSLNIELENLDDVSKIDITIDGADEVTEGFQGIKGGGGAHLFEKLVAKNSKENIWIIDETKCVEKLGKFPLPVEVVKFGSKRLFQYFKDKPLQPSWRKDEQGNKFLTDDNNYIIDLHLGFIDKPHELADWVSNLTGVVEHGLFLDIVDRLVIGTEDGPKVRNRE